MDSMQKNDFIPQIKPDEAEPKPAFQEIGEDKHEGVDHGNKEDSLLIPKISANEDAQSKTAESKVPLKREPQFGKRKKWLKPVLIVLGVFLLVNIVLFLNVYFQAKKLVSNLKEVKSAVNSQDLNQLKSSLIKTDKTLARFKNAYTFISYLKIVPFAGGYVKDGSRIINAGVYSLELTGILIDTLEPYADLIGFSGGKTDGNGEKTAADRIDFIVQAIPTILPKMDEITNKMDLVKGEVDKINTNRYPVRFMGREVKSQMEKGIDLIDQAAGFIKNGKPLLKEAPYLLGLESPRTYLVLFQNDKELRPTGGFMTAYSIMKVDKAKFEPVDSSDIYNLDAKYKPAVKAPQPIIDYIKGPYVLSKNLRLRDMNWSPDFAESMALFTGEIEKVGIKEIDGIIAVDTQLLVNLLNVLGPIGVSGFGNFSTEVIPECNCPQVIFELESFADVEGPVVWDPAGTGKIIYQPPNADNRKKIIGPLMNAVLANALGQPKERLPKLFEAAFKSLLEKHILFYLHEETAQKAAENFGIAGKMSNFEGDYLHINDSNLGGRKSNLYITQEVNQEITVAKDGSVEKTLLVTYNNPEKQDGWLNSVLPNWVRIYVPKGSELLSINGLSDNPEPYEEFGKTVFAGYFELRPLGVNKVEIKYKLPFKVKDSYKLFLQKQAGTDAPLYVVKVNNKQEELYLKVDKELKFPL